MSVYQIFQMLRIDAGNGGNYEIFRKDMKRAFAMYMGFFAYPPVEVYFRNTCVA